MSKAATQNAGELAVVILAAGQGTRMRSSLPKVLHKVAGRPMVRHVLEAAAALRPGRIITIVGPDAAAVGEAVHPHPTVVQQERLGTGHAMMQALPLLVGWTGPVLTLCGDTPLLTTATLAGLVQAYHEADAGAAILGFEPAEPGSYGRLVAGADGVEAIVEARDATPEQRSIRLCNAGMMAFDGARLAHWLGKLDNNNAKGEYYLTDLVALARAEGRRVALAMGEEHELLGVNDRVALAEAEAACQDRLRMAVLEGGATLVDPASVTLSADTVLEPDVTVEPHVVFAPGVTVAAGATIRSFSHLEGCIVGPGCTVGPFARLRPGAVLEDGARVGNYVEVKQATLGKGAKVPHLSYVGDASVGAGANIGAGTITCNYDGFAKYHTEIGAGAFVGSDTTLVAPVTVGAGAVIGAGSTITKDVPADSLAITRVDQKTFASGAVRYRAKRTKSKGKT